MRFFKGEVPNLVLVILWTLILVGGYFLAPACGSGPEKGKAAPEISPGEPLDFDTCARIAIRQSPFLTKSDLEIQIRHMDEKDSKADFLPSFHFQTRYYTSQVTQGGATSSPYSLNFVSETYSPVEAYLSLQVRKIITRIAILTHLKAISEGLHRLGRMFIEMDSFNQMAQVQAELIQLTGKNLTFIQEQQKIGQGTALEFKVASQELEIAKMQHQKFLEGLKKMKESIRTFLALPADQELRFDLPRSRSQLLGNFEPSADVSEALRTSSFDYKIQALKRELQQYKITLAKTKLLPTLTLGAQTPDPLSLVQSRSLFFYVGANIPVWDGFKRLRDISRQKTVLRQLDAETNEKDINFTEKWRTSQAELAETAMQLKISQSQLELAILKEKQLEIRYHNMGEPLPVYLEGEKGVSEAKKSIITKTLDYDQAKLNLRNLANDLVPHYVNENSLPQRSEEKN